MALGLIVIGVGTFAAINPGVVAAFRRGLYPTVRQSGRRSWSFVQDHKLNRLGPDQRENCDKRPLQPLGEVTAAEQPNVNMVDLRRDALQGSMPHSDRVRLQKNQHALHAPR